MAGPRSASGMLGGCQIIDVLGKGGMGVVYRALEGTPPNARQVALKTIAPEHVPDAAVRERFEREVSLAMRIDHENVIPFYRWGVEDGVPFFVMRLVEGATLDSDLLKAGRFSLSRAMRVIEQIASALDFMHEREVVHGDIRPANILLTPGGHVYVTDFGLARSLHDAGGGVHLEWYSPGYTPPEQQTGAPPDCRSDIYSLACVLYNALSGSAPFVDAAVLGSRASGYLDSERPSLAGVGDVPAALDSVISRAMARDPEDRYASAGDFLLAARDALEGRQPADRDNPVARGRAKSRTMRVDRTLARSTLAHREFVGAVARLEGRARGHFQDARTKTKLDEIARRLADPLRVAVVGEIKAGKSTLVNALLRTPLAPTDSRECTKIVTWFRYGEVEQFKLRYRSGRVADPAPLDWIRPDAEGRADPRFNPNPADVEAIEIEMKDRILKEMTLIDTPGLGSLDSESVDRTIGVLPIQDSRNAGEQAEALIFVVNQDIVASELEALRHIRNASAGLGQAVSVVGVLTRADRIGAGGAEAWNEAVRVAAANAERHRGVLSTVIPVIGLIGATAESGGLTEALASALREIAQLDARTRSVLLGSRSEFVREDAAVGVEAAVRLRIFDLLGMYGIRKAVERIDELGAQAAREGRVPGGPIASELHDYLLELSGLPALRARLLDEFRRRGPALKARAALEGLDKLTVRQRDDSPADLEARTWLADELGELKLSPAMHELEELEVLQACSSGEIELPASLHRDLVRMTTADSLAKRLDATSSEPAALREAAGDGVERWHQFVGLNAGLRASHVARVMMRSYELALDAIGVREQSDAHASTSAV